MPFGRAAHRGVPTRVDAFDSDLDALFVRWAARCSAIALRHQRRYIDRMVKLAHTGDFAVEQRGYTHGGAEPFGGPRRKAVDSDP